MKIIKRNGMEKPFDIKKIESAVRKANDSVVDYEKLDDDQIQSLVSNVEKACENMKRSPSVEEIQDMVENQLMSLRAFNVARNYITYRYKRELVRKSNSTDEQILSLLECNNEEVKQENSNKNPTINSVQRDYMAGEVSKDITKRFLLPPDIVEAHEKGIIHFHDADYFAQHMHNCFSSKTKFVTSRGVKSFAECSDGEELLVLTKNGTWRAATVHKYGKQEMQLVTLQSGRTIKTIKCTPNHRWLLKDGTVTTELKEGDRLFLLPDVIDEDLINPDAFCLGFVLGDGSDVISPTGSGVRIRLCGEKTKYEEMFVKAGYRKSLQTFKNKDILMTKSGAICKEDFIAMRGWRYMSLNDKKSLFLGYYAADGSTDRNQIATANEHLLCMIQEISALAGFHITSIKSETRDTNYKKRAILHTVRFMRHQPENRNWIVKSIKRDSHGEAYDAWCVEEPETNTFTLDGGIVTGNCCLVNLDDMLQNGTVISETMIDRPKSFSTACNIATQAIAQIASSQYGGQSISLSHLAPFVQVSREKYRKQVRVELEAAGIEPTDEKINKIAELRVKEEINRGVQMIQYQVITLMTTNGQAPFITVFMYLNEVPEGQLRDDLAAVIEEMLHQRILGVKNEKGVYITPAFPKLIYVLEEDNIREGAKYWYLTKLAAECTSKRMVPDYISEKIMKKLKDGNCYTCMGCRSFLTVYHDENGNPKFYGRFNQGVVTLNLVDVACSSGKDMDKFWELMDERLDLCYRALMARHNRLKGTPSDVAPILWQNGALARLKKGETIDKLLYNGYSTISLGYAGLCECTRYMKGVSHTDPEGTEFALKVMRYLNDACAKWRAKENIDFSLYGTPLESTTYKFAKCLQKRFGVIEDVTDKNYITNSYHVHVTENINAFDKLKFESQFQKLSPGGAISYVEVPNMQNNIPAVLSVIQFIYGNIMYAELNTKSDYCMECGYDGEIQIVTDTDGKLVWECPCCGNRNQDKMNVARRTCGYIGTQFWNQGRTQEIKERRLHL